MQTFLSTYQTRHPDLIRMTVVTRHVEVEMEPPMLLLKAPMTINLPI